MLLLQRRRTLTGCLCVERASSRRVLGAHAKAALVAAPGPTTLRYVTMRYELWLASVSSMAPRRWRRLCNREPFVRLSARLWCVRARPLLGPDNGCWMTPAEARALKCEQPASNSITWLHTPLHTIADSTLNSASELLSTESTGRSDPSER